MKILYDHQIFGLQKFGGISNSFVQLITHFPKSVQYEVAIKECDNIHLRGSQIADFKPVNSWLDSFFSTKNFRGKDRLYELFAGWCPQLTTDGRNLAYSINRVEKGDYDVFHPTFFDDYFVEHLNGKPFVLTIHDMIPELFSTSDKLQIENKKRLARSASHIIAVSEKTKEDIVELLKIPEDKISVIYHGAPLGVQGKHQPLFEFPYILYVGNRNYYKNFLPMINDLASVLLRHDTIRIVCTGDDFSIDERNVFKKLNIEDRMVHIRPSDDHLYNLYEHALCFIFPSLYEGFGIPILEAYKAGCPVLLNRKSCFPEIAQDAAMYFTLDEDQSDLAEVMESFLEMDPPSRQRLIEKQNLRLADFSWEKSASELCEVYQQLCE